MFQSLFLKNYNYKKYIILSLPRSGSTLLSRMMLAHPNVKGEGEYFDRLKNKNPEVLLETLFSPQKMSVQAVGFNIHYNHPADEKKDEAWMLLRESPDLHVIHLSRKNILRYYLSTKIARKLNVFRIKRAKDRPDLESRKVIIAPQELEKTIANVERDKARFNSIFSAKPMIEVEYEKIILNPKMEFQRLTSFLELPEKEPKLLSEIMNPEPLAELIINYDELKAEFKSTEWSWMFE